MENLPVNVSEKADLTLTLPFGKVEANGETANLGVFLLVLVVVFKFWK